VLSVPDAYRLGDHTFTDHDPHPVEQWTVADILAQSSNIGTMLLAKDLGRNRLASYLERFGLGTKTDLGFPGESGGLIRPVDTWSSTDMGSIPIGQGVAVTAMQMLSAFNVIANDGVYVAPKLLAATGRGTDRTETAASARHRVIADGTASAMQTMMAQVVNEGTGEKAAVPGYQAAGKTGTARIPQRDHTPGNSYLDAQGRYHYMSSFGGFVVGADLSILIVMEEPQTSVYASDTAAPVFSQLASWALRRYQIPPPALVTQADTSVPELTTHVDEQSDNELPVAGAVPSTSTSGPSDTTATTAPTDTSEPDPAAAGAVAGGGTGG
jgi:cell division protein FtsI (penicillin-binding protein 3)